MHGFQKSCERLNGFLISLNGFIELLSKLLSIPNGQHE